MADVTDLRCWPSCVDAIDWSQDGIIALASDEHVELLFPNTVTFDRDQDVPQWKHTPLQVPWFSNEELPTKEPAPLPNYSIGEEISGSAPISIAWSPPGLAKHRRCALAALTANLVLSIWASDGKPQEGSSWDRRLIVNNAMARYFLNKASDEQNHVAPDFGERMRLRTRVRSFTWAPALPSSHSSYTLGTRLLYGQHMVAICNDDNQIALVVVDSPTSTLGAEQSWNAEVLTHVSLTSDSKSIFSIPASFDDLMKQQRHILCVAWSPWIIRGDWYHAVIAYATNEDVRARTVAYTLDSISMSEEVVYPGIEMRYKGPMKWSPAIEHGDAVTLALFTMSGFINLKVSAVDASIIERTTHDLDGRWDQTSGAIWDLAQRPTPRLHFSSLLSTTQSPTCVLEPSSDGLKALGTPSWRDQIVNSAVLFSAKNDLKGNSKVKVWGLATSPMGDFIATCHSVHPSEMIEYGSPHDRRGTVTVNALRQYRQICQSFPLWDVSAEGVLFTLKKLVQNTVELTDQMIVFADEIVEKMMQAYSPTGTLGDSNDISVLASDPEDLNALTRDFKKVAFLDSHTLKDRYTILVSHACNTTSSNNLPRTLIAYRVATAVQGLPISISRTTFSTEVLTHHRQIISLVHSLIDTAGDEIGLSQSESDTIAVARLHHGTTRSDSVGLDFASATVDTCDFCAASIPFTDLTSATCTNGHKFPRCGLSFLAIQAPGITKYCGICSTPYLSEEFVFVQEKEIGTDLVRRQEDTDKVTALVGDLSFQTQTNGNGMNKADGNELMAVGSTEGEQAQRNVTVPARVYSELLGGLAGEEGKIKLPMTLAKVLFLACDACIYCGGKFMG